MANNLLRARVDALKMERHSAPTVDLTHWPKRAKEVGVKKALGEFLKTVAIRKGGLTSVVGSLGGYLVPEELLVDVNTILKEYSIFQNLSINWPMGAKTTKIPTYDLNASHAVGDSPLIGGFSMAWKPEAAALPESNPDFNQNALVAKDIEALCVCSDDLVEDGGLPLAMLLEHGFRNGISWYVDRACFRGALDNQPQGVVESPASVVCARAGAGTIAIADLAKMAGSLVPACFPRAVWAFHPTVVEKVTALAQFQISEPIYEGTGLMGCLMGRPAYCTEKLPSLGNKGDIVLFDPKQYVLGTRQVEIAAAPSMTQPTYAATRQTLFRIIWRGDGKFLAKGTVTLEDNVTVRGVSVVLNS